MKEFLKVNDVLVENKRKTRKNCDMTKDRFMKSSFDSVFKNRKKNRFF